MSDVTPRSESLEITKYCRYIRGVPEFLGIPLQKPQGFLIFFEGLEICFERHWINPIDESFRQKEQRRPKGCRIIR